MHVDLGQFRFGAISGQQAHAWTPIAEGCWGRVFEIHLCNKLQLGLSGGELQILTTHVVFVI